MENQKVVKIVCEIYKAHQKRFLEVLQEIGVTCFHFQSGKTVVLKEKPGRFFLPARTVLEEDSNDIFSFYVPFEQMDAIISKIAKEIRLATPGNGSIYAESVELVYSSDFNYIQNVTVKEEKEIASAVVSDLMGLRCIVQRSDGDKIASASLEMGITVPTISFGIGTGLRDKLGLLRITIPAEKEIVNLVVIKSELEGVMNILIHAGKLDYPGKGFIYTYPVLKGIINSKILRGKEKYAASMEQIIMAIDQLKNNTDWRERSFGNENQSSKKRKFLTSLLDLTFFCNEGKAEEIVDAAMAKGASGATISKLKFGNFKEEETNISRAREMATLIIPSNQKENITNALIDAGLFSSETAGFIEIKDAPKACTYLEK